MYFENNSIKKNKEIKQLLKTLIYEIIKTIKQIKKDNKGQLLIPTELKLADKEYKYYRELSVDWTIPPVKNNDLPDEFSDKACKLVDIFRRKTINLDFECMIYFDYKTAEIIYCFIGKENYVDDMIDEFYFKNKRIASIHNHAKNYLSPPSPENFEILKISSEDYEIISAYDSLWILEAKGEYDKKFVKEFQEKISKIFKISVINVKNNKFDNNELNKLYGYYLLNLICNEKDNIELTKKEL